MQSSQLNPLKRARRTAVAVLVIAALTPQAVAIAQRREPAPQPAESPRPVAPDDRDARDTREKLANMLSQYPPSLTQVLRLDPSLLSNPAYLAPYPGLASFLAQHPEVAHNPAFFIGAGRIEYYEPGSEKRMLINLWQDMMAGIAAFTAALIFFSLLGWLVRTLIEHRRWLRISRVQTEVHTKLLDRFTANEDLLAYMQTPAGRRFLESAPISTEVVGPRAFSAPIGRILWSVQAGVVLAMGGAGLGYVSGRVVDEMREPLFVIGALAMALGLGFIVSAVIAFALTRQLGLIDRSARGGDGEPKPATLS